ncbi:MAG: hypothetical protein UHY68_01090 [Acutalibacteraceae bacterium]|nr:hypothetical protein [Acutalibacteraceae bacterium]
MSLFDDIVDNAKLAANTVGKKAGQLKEYSKLKYSESGIKSEINKKKLALGDYVYECTKLGNVDQNKMQTMISEITELEENLLITKEMIISSKNKTICNGCRAENDKESIFCCKCGQKLTSENDQTVCNCDVTVISSVDTEDIKSEPVEADELEDITVAEKTSDNTETNSDEEPELTAEPCEADEISEND